MKTAPMNLPPIFPPDITYTSQFLRGARVLIHIGKDGLYPGMVVKDFQDTRPTSCGRRCIIDMGGHRWERFFDCDDLIAI